MTLLSLSADLRQTNDLLERIAVALERGVGPVAEDATVERKPYRTEPQDIGRTRSAEDLAMGRLKRIEGNLR